jgi:carbonic anhydrase
MDRTFHRSQSALVLAAALGVFTAHAGSGHGAPAEAAHAPAPAASSAPRPTAPAASAAASPAETPAAVTHAAPVDPLARIQQRLAARFGAQSTAGHAAEGPVVRVVSKASTTTAAAADVAPPSGELVLKAHAAARARRPAPPAEPAHEVHWSYAGEGAPSAWGHLKPEFALCSSGQRQSPIDIRDGIRLGLEPVQFDYRPSSFRVVDNGHTIQVDIGAGNSIEVGGQRYELVQFHFHRPSEEAIDGRRFDMVAHFVHKSLDGRLAVVAVLIERGAAQAQLQQVWNHLPLERGDSMPARATLDLERLLPEQRGYFNYMGSLTTPPCSEGVLWIVMKQPVSASIEQLGVFARLYPMNARPLQSAGGRRIKESN